MDVRIAAIADFASITREGKLNIMGVFSQLNPPKLPYNHPQMFLVAGLTASAAEADTVRKITFVLMDEDGKKLLSADNEIRVRTPPVAGVLAEANQLLCVANARFTKAGLYQFSILIDADEKTSISFRVNDPPKADLEPQDDTDS